MPPRGSIDCDTSHASALSISSRLPRVAGPMKPVSDLLDEAQKRLDGRRASLGIERRAERRLARAEATRIPIEAPKQLEDDDESDPFDAPIPDGLYVVRLVREERGHPYGRPVVFAHFVIAEGQFAGRALLRFYNESRGSRLARTSSLYRDFVAVTGRRPPAKAFRPSWAFSDCMLRARVVTVRERVDKGARIPMAEWETYSKIDTLVALVSGESPAMRGTTRHVE